MTATFDDDAPGAKRIVACRGRAERLADSFDPPEDELGHALAAVLARENLDLVATALSDDALRLLSGLLPNAPTSIAAPLVCLAAAAGIDPVPVAERLLATGDADDGHAAILALGICDAKAALRRALKHPRYRARCAALTRLVETSQDTTERSELLSAADDRSADMRLAWAELMKKHRWPEAINSLIRLLGDQRNFSNDPGYVSGPSWPQYSVAWRL